MNRNAILLDTHVWIWFITGESSLAVETRKVINHAIAENCAYIAAISVWELSMLVAKGRIELDKTCSNWVHKAIVISGIEVMPLSPEVSIESCYLPGKFHDDPADRIIVATARVENLTLLTKDRRVLDYGDQNFVSTVSV